MTFPKVCKCGHELKEHGGAKNLPCLHVHIAIDDDFVGTASLCNCEEWRPVEPQAHLGDWQHEAA